MTVRDWLEALTAPMIQSLYEPAAGEAAAPTPTAGGRNVLYGHNQEQQGVSSEPAGWRPPSAAGTQNKRQLLSQLPFVLVDDTGLEPVTSRTSTPNRDFF